MEEKDILKKKDKRPTYEPPKAVDLSDSSASGQRRNCRDGGHALANCSAGSSLGGSNN
jgi:hypothetical protein